MFLINLILHLLAEQPLIKAEHATAAAALVRVAIISTHPRALCLDVLAKREGFLEALWSLVGERSPLISSNLVCVISSFHYFD